MTILIVEDELYARQSLEAQLYSYDRNREFTVLQAANGQEGLGIFRQRHPDLVITDIKMPRMDGIEMLQEIKKLNQDTPVVIMTAYSDFQYARDALKAGAVDYLLKPVDEKAVADCLDRYYERAGSTTDAEQLSGQDAAVRCVLMTMEGQQPDFIGKRLFDKTFHDFYLAALNPSGQRLRREQLRKWIEESAGSVVSSNMRLIGRMNGLWILVMQGFETYKSFIMKLQTRADENGCLVSCGVSARHSGADSVSAAWDEAYHALLLRMTDVNPVHFHEQADESDGNRRVEFRISKDQETLLEQALEHRNGARFTEVLHAVFADIPRNPQARSLETLYLHLRVICLRAAGLQGNVGGRVCILDDYGILQCDSLQEMETYFMDVGRQLCEDGALSQDRRDILSCIEEYVNKHYSEEVTIKKLAEEILFMNRDYVSHVFAEQKRMNFSVYLRQVRMAHAKEFLAQSSLSVSEVARLTGYKDFSQFIRNFKLETGMTPKKYRDSQRNIRQSGRTENT